MRIRYNLEQMQLTIVSDLELDGYANWRLPTIYELESIIDYTRYDPALSDVLEGHPENYWSDYHFTLLCPVITGSCHFTRASFSERIVNDPPAFYARCVHDAMRKLTITKTGSGSGKVTSSPLGIGLGIDCGDNCTDEFPVGTEVSPCSHSGTRFRIQGLDGWRLFQVRESVSITLNDNETVTAQFEPVHGISGKVLKEDGSGLEGVPITLTAPDGSTREKTTDANGYYAFWKLFDGNYKLTHPASFANYVIKKPILEVLLAGTE